jgi:hypothetical protein
MKFEVTLTTDEFAALSKAPGRSAQQRMRWLVKFWQAVCEERESKAADTSPWIADKEQRVDMTDPEVQAVVGLNERGEQVQTVGTACERLLAADTNDGYGAKVTP